jgi:cation diffusion facilitator family transporter
LWSSRSSVGLYIHSLSLLSDAGHNLADVAALALALLAFRLSGSRPTDRYTYGYSKTSILVALFNALVLLVSIGAITYEAVQRFIHPEPLPGLTIALISRGTAFLSMPAQHISLCGKKKKTSMSERPICISRLMHWSRWPSSSAGSSFILQGFMS